MKCERNCVRSDELNYFEDLARIPGILSVAIIVREEFTIDRWKVTAFLGNRFPRRRSGA